MEPRPFSRGNHHGPDRQGTRLVFQLQWSRGLSAAETLKPLEPAASGLRASMEPRPFSRGNSNRTLVAGPVPRASMEPRPFSRGNDVRSTVIDRSARGFNGAAAFQPRKPVL